MSILNDICGCPECALIALEHTALTSNPAPNSNDADLALAEAASNAFYDLYDELGFTEADWPTRFRRTH